MKRILKSLLAASLCAGMFVHLSAQNVGIGIATPHASAKLHIEDANRGLMIPRVSLSNVTNGTTPVNGPLTGLLVFNTNAAVTGGSGTGFYYWDGSQWVMLATGQSNDWALLGNAGTNATTNFVGTTDAQNLNFRTNNGNRFRITTGGQLQSYSSGTNTAPAYTWQADPNTGMYRYAADQLAFSTAGNLRVWMSSLGEVFVGAAAPVLPGDMFITTADGALATTFPWAVNGYTDGVGAGVYGLRLGSSGGTYGAVQGETSAANPSDSPGISGTVPSTAHIGVRGYKPAGGLGWGGVFYNDLGYTGWFGNASDRSLKKNITPLTGALAIVNQLPIYSYQYQTEKYDNLGDDGTHFGVMADELRPLLPDLVRTKSLSGVMVRNGDEQPRCVEQPVDMVNYIELVPVALQAIKEQQEIIQQQSERIEALEQKVRELEQK